MKVLTLCHFNQITGPIPIIHTPNEVNKDTLDHIAHLMDVFMERDFFVYYIKGIKSVNAIFEVENPHARGKSELLLISILVTEGDINIDLAKNMLNDFIIEMQGIKDVYRGLYDFNDENNKIAVEKYAEIKRVFHNFYHNIPLQNVVQQSKDTKVFIFGLSKAGKTTIIKQLQKKTQLETLPTANVGISRLFLNNMSFLTYDTPGQTKFRQLWTPYLRSQDALVFVLDAYDVGNYNNAKELLHQILSIESVNNVPLLILLNKSDLAQPDVDLIVDGLELNVLNPTKYKIFVTSAKENVGLEQAFNWLTNMLADKGNFTEITTNTQEIADCIIFSRWDEDSGLEILSVHPDEAIMDPELIAIKCFSLAELIYGGESFKDKVSFTLPLSHLNAHASIYFDFIEDKSIRGGKLPLSLVLLYKNEQMKQNIERTNKFITKKFNKFKSYYNNNLKVTKVLEEIYQKTLAKNQALNLKESDGKSNGISRKFDDFFSNF